MLSGQQLERITEKVKGIFILRTNNWKEFSESEDAPHLYSSSKYWRNKDAAV